MSAFLCEKELFFALSCFAVGKSHSSMRVNPNYLDIDKQSAFKCPQNGTGYASNSAYDLAVAIFYANVLQEENIRSLVARYGEGGAEDFTDDDLSIPLEIKRIPPTQLNAVQLFKLCDCLEYQSCETSDYEESLAFKILTKIRREIIQTLDGYANAKWGIPEHARVMYQLDGRFQQEPEPISIFNL